MHDEAIQSGQEKYDEVFVRVLQLKLRAEQADGKEAARSLLAKAVGAQPTTPAEDVINATKSKANDLSTSGARYFMALSPLVRLYGEGKFKEFEEALIASAVQGMRRSEELRGMASEMRDLRSKIDSLKNEVVTDFADLPRRDEVLRELEASKLVLETAELRAKSEAGEALAFAIALAGALDTGGVAAAPVDPPAPPKPSRPKPGAAKPTAKPAAKPVPKPAAGPPAPEKPPATKPPGKPKPVEDFDP